MSEPGPWPGQHWGLPDGLFLSSALVTLPLLHSGPPASWLQPTLAVPLQDLSGVQQGLAGQSLRLEWAAGVGSCVLLPRDARRCRLFLEELIGKRWEREAGRALRTRSLV